MADALVDDGYLAAGYDGVHIDDCWEAATRAEDGTLGYNSTRFPSGISSLAAAIHSKGAKLGLYSDVGTNTCGGYPGSEGHAAADAALFAAWGVDYLKYDGCYSGRAGWDAGYPVMGAALQKTGRDVVYSCSWPAYLGDDENRKPYARMTAAGCNLWRNWDDIDNSWSSVATIIAHYGEYSHHLASVAGPGLGWNDMDMILAGDDHYGVVLPLEQAKTQLAVWSVAASALMLAADLRTVADEYKAVILNAEMIAVSQDVLGAPGVRAFKDEHAEVWTRCLENGDVAAVLYNAAQEGTEPLTIDVVFNALPMLAGSATWAVRDIWAGADLGAASGSWAAAVAPTESRFVRLSLPA
jgi:hypothetical protein